VAGAPPADFGRLPRDTARFLELDDVILPDAAAGERHGERVPDLADALPGRRRGQVGVAIPARLLERVRDELEDSLRRSRDLAAGAHYPLSLIVRCHDPI
jgi:hypothetical protein